MEFENANDTEKLNCRYGYPAARWVHFASDSFLSFSWSHSIEESNYKRSLHERLKSIREKKNRDKLSVMVKRRHQLLIN